MKKKKRDKERKEVNKGRKGRGMSQEKRREEMKGESEKIQEGNFGENEEESGKKGKIDKEIRGR